MSLQTTYTLKQLESIQKRGGQYLTVVIKNDYLTAGHVISWHRGYEAAAKAIGNSKLARIVGISEAITAITKGH